MHGAGLQNDTCLGRSGLMSDASRPIDMSEGMAGGGQETTLTTRSAWILRGLARCYFLHLHEIDRYWATLR